MSPVHSVTSIKTHVVETIDDKDERNDGDTKTGLTGIGESSGETHDEAESETHPHIRNDPHGSSTHLFTECSQGEGRDHVPRCQTTVDSGDGEWVGDSDRPQYWCEVAVGISGDTHLC